MAVQVCEFSEDHKKMLVLSYHSAVSCINLEKVVVQCRCPGS